jgi:TrmH family RNA methyltransferase
MGALFTQKFVRAGLKELKQWKQRENVMLVGTSPDAPNDYREVCYKGPVVLFMGCERKGLSQERQSMCDHLVRIPMVGRADSLNLAVATGVLLYEVFRQKSNWETR